MRTINGTIGLFLCSLLLLFNASGQAQRSVNYCLTDQVERQIIKDASPEMRERILKSKKEVRQAWHESGQRAGLTFIIPVVFHVVHDNGPENLDRQVILNAVEQMNKDFRKRNGDTSNIHSNFKSLATDVEVEFRLAQKDPNGNCHTGINRIRSNQTYDGSQNSGIKDLIQWDPSSYLNIWVCNSIGSGVAAYASKPSIAEFDPDRDGIVAQYSYVGSDEHTLTHEAGHYLSLDHPWGTCGNPGDPGNCSGSNCDNSTCNTTPPRYYDDGICDTPHTVGWMSCDKNGSSCGTLDNVQNYMSYSYCHLMFTAEQANAMRSTLQNSTGDRDQLWTNTNLQETGVAFDGELCEVNLNTHPRVVCEGDSIEFSYRAFQGPISWDWEMEGADPNTSTARTPKVSYSDTGHYDLTLIAENSSGKDSILLEDHISVIPKTGDELPFTNTLDWIPDLHAHPQFDVLNPQGDSIEWEHTQKAGEGGSKGSVMLDNFNNSSGYSDAVATTTIDASSVPSGNLRLAFDIAYSRINSGDQDELIIYTSTGCSDNWNQKASFSADSMATASPDSNAFYPSGSQWKRLSVNSSLVGVNVEDLRFKFQFKSDGGNNVFIDNINIHDEENVSIEEELEEEASWELYPNPVDEQAYLELQLNESERVNVDILDLRGQKVREIRNGEAFSSGQHRIRMDLSDLEAGPYFVRVRAGEERSTKKLFKR
jgi:PKD repeat protein